MSSEPKSAEGARELGNGVRTPTSRVADGSHGDHGHQCLNYLEHQPKSAWMVLQFSNDANVLSPPSERISQCLPFPPFATR